MRLSKENHRGVLLLMIAILFGYFMPAQPGVCQNSAKETVQELVTLFSAVSNTRKNKEIYEELSKHIDYQDMAEITLSKPNWDKLNSSQRSLLVAAFRTLVEQRYYERWHKLFLRGRLTIVSEAHTAGEDIVKTFLTEGKDEDVVVWRLHEKNGALLVVNLEANGKDLLRRLSPRFRKQFAKHGFYGLLAWIQRKSDLDDDDDVSEKQQAASPVTAR
jgi:ABC-type transporter MlaC component